MVIQKKPYFRSFEISPYAGVGAGHYKYKLILEATFSDDSELNKYIILYKLREMKVISPMLSDGGLAEYYLVLDHKLSDEQIKEITFYINGLSMPEVGKISELKKREKTMLNVSVDSAGSFSGFSYKSGDSGIQSKAFRAEGNLYRLEIFKAEKKIFSHEVDSSTVLNTVTQVLEGVGHFFVNSKPADFHEVNRHVINAELMRGLAVPALDGIKGAGRDLERMVNEIISHAISRPDYIKLEALAEEAMKRTGRAGSIHL